MRFIEDLIPLRLYPASKKLFIPIDLKNKKKGSAIILLSPTSAESQVMANLPYVYNPNYFNSYYISRDVTAYIDDGKLEMEAEDDTEEAVQESFYYTNGRDKIEMEFDKSVSSATKRKVEVALNTENWFKETVKTIKMNDIGKIDFTIYEHRSYEEIQKYTGKKGIHGYADADSVRIVSESNYTDEDGEYENYIKHEIVSMLLHNINPDINPVICAFVSGYFSDQYKDKKVAHTNTVKGSQVLADLIKAKGYGPVRTMIRTNDIGIIANFAGRNVAGKFMKLFEASMPAKERNALPDSEFGIPSQRKYPLNDEAHVRAAIKMFNHVDSAHEEELARRIKSKMKKFGIDDVEVGPSNKFSKYYTNKKKESSKKESAILESVAIPDGVQSPEDLSRWMKSNIRYDSSNHPLYTPEEVMENKKGNCHDQVLFERAVLGKLGYSTGALFLFEHDGKGQGGETHSICYYIKDGKTNWFENAWTPKAGIHKYNSKPELIDAFKQMHNSGTWGNHNNFPELEIETFKGKPGMSLQQVVDVCLESTIIPLTEALGNKVDFRDIKRIVDNLTPQEKKWLYHGDTFKDSPYVVYRNLKYLKGIRGSIGGFLEAYIFPKEEQNMYISIAVEKQARGKGIADDLVTEFMQVAKLNYPNKTVIWKVNEDNIASIKLAKRHGFTRNKDGDYIYHLSGSAIMESSLNSINENLLFNAKDVFINLDEWKAEPGHNILYITGLSGSGKSTITQELAKKNEAIPFPLDGLDEGIDVSGKHIIDKIKKKYPKYKKYVEAVKNNTLEDEFTCDEVDKIYAEALAEALSIIEADSNNKYIVEGIQIYIYMEPDYLYNKPVIIKGTSAIQSFLRRMRRHSDDGKINWTEELKNDFIGMVNWYRVDMESSKHLRNSLIRNSNKVEYYSEADEYQENPKVYFTKEITSESLVKIYKALGKPLYGRTLVKLSTGEPGGHNFLNPTLIKDLVDEVHGTIGDANTAYEGKRQHTDSHYKVMDDHGFSAIAPVDVLDAEGDKEIPIKNHNVISKVYIGSHMDNYDSFLVLSHFKGHAMAGFGGAIKNVGISMASSRGKSYVHTGGRAETGFEGDHETFLKSLADSANGIMDYMGDNVVYINIANNISVDCDCDAHPADPCMADIGIFASTDPLAVDKACIDAIKNAPNNEELIERINRQTGLNTLAYSNNIGMGSLEYDLVDIDSYDIIPKTESHMAPGWDNEDFRNNRYCITEDFMRVDTGSSDFITFFGEDTNSSYLRRYLYKERLKNSAAVANMYRNVKESNPWIKKTFLKIGMYSGNNVFVDVSYYNGLFIQNNIRRMDKGVELYWDFVNRLINNKEIDDIYGKKTIFIPVDRYTWGTGNVDDFVNYKVNLNPISMIFRMMKTHPELIAREWGNKTFLFVGKRGYFTIDFSTFKFANLARIKHHLTKLFSDTEPIIDDENPKDSMTPDEDSSAVIAAKVTEKINDKLGTDIPLTAVSKSYVDYLPYVDNLPIDKAEDLVFYYTNKVKIPEHEKNYIAILGTDSNVGLARVIPKLQTEREIDSYVKPKE